MWGCPIYILDPQLQDGPKLPRWEPRSRRGVFMGFSNLHSSGVPLVLNLDTGSITRQFHVVFDDLFSTVPSVEMEHEPPDNWDQLCLENTTFIPVDEHNPDASTDRNPSDHLQFDWMTPEEQDLLTRATTRQTQIRDKQTPAIVSPIRAPRPVVSVPIVGSTFPSYSTTVPPSSTSIPSTASTSGTSRSGTSRSS